MSQHINNYPTYIDNGVPCANYIVYFGQAGVDPKANQKPIYADALFTTELPNPQTLNAGGNYKQEIQLDGEYSILIERPNGTVFFQDLSILGLGSASGGTVTLPQVTAAIDSAISLNNMFRNDPAQNSGLLFNYGPYRIQLESGAQVEVTGESSIALPNNTTVFVYFDPNSGTVGQGTTVPQGHNSLYQVTTAGNVISSTIDKRTTYSNAHPLPDNYIDGLTLTLGADTAHDVTTATGEARDSSNALDLTLSTPMTKQLDANWAAGNNAGGLPSTVTLVDAMTIYVFLIGKDDGAIDVGFDDNTSATKLLVASTYTHYRQLGSFTINASLNIADNSLGAQVDNTFALSAAREVAEGRSSVKVLQAGMATDSVGPLQIEVGAVHQAELNTSTHAINVAPSGFAVLNGGQYGFYPQVSGHPSIETRAQISNNAIGSGTKTVIANLSIISVTATQRYINASAPYDIGDGETPFFVFLEMDSNGDVANYSISDTPPWIYNGPTDVTGKRYVQTDGTVKYGRYMSTIAAEAREGGKSLSDFVKERKVTKRDFEAGGKVFQEITPLDKNADMNLIPHPFGNPQGTVVLLDPMDDFQHVLCELHNSGEDISDLITQGLVIDNKANGRHSSPNVMPVNFRLK